MWLWRRLRRDPRLGDELRFHRDRFVEDHVARGVDRREAERRAFLEFGNVATLEEQCRDARGRWLEDLAQDLRYGLRTLRRGPMFAVVAIVSLAVGIGANTAIFSLINSVMLRPLPVSDAERLVQIGRVRQDAGQPGRLAFVSYPLYEHLRDHMKSVDAMFAQSPRAQAIAIQQEDDVVNIDAVSGSYFSVLELTPAAGRFFDPSDDVPSAGTAVAVITDRYWQRRFGGRSDAIGASILVGQRSFTIVGVAPRGYMSAQTGRAVDVIVPLMTMLTLNQRTYPDNHFLVVLGRLKVGHTAAEANAEAEALFDGFLQAHVSEVQGSRRAEILREGAGVQAAPGGFNPTRAAIARPLLIIMGVFALVLLLACVNVSGLLLARAEARHREVSVRLAIGAGRGRLARQFLTEALALALIGGGLGFVIARWFSVALLNLFVSGRDVVMTVDPDWRVLGFAVLATLATCLATGLVPALGVFHVNVNPGLKGDGGPGRRIGKALVTAQLAISMVLVVGATLFVGTLVKLYAVDRGFESDGVLVVNLRSTSSYSREQRDDIQRQMLVALRALPGVRSASAAQALPVGGRLPDRSIQVDGHAARADDPNVGFNVIAPGYFSTLRTPLVAGRDFADRDTITAPRVAIVNESFERDFFGRGSALGRRVTSSGATYEIVGVVRDTNYQGLREPMSRTVYVASAQRVEMDQPSSYSYLVQTTAENPLRLVPEVERAIREVNSGLRGLITAPYESLINRSIANERVMAALAGVSGSLGLFTAAVGMFGVLAFRVARRTRELAVRMVLGADRPSVIRLVLRDVVEMLVPGLVIGAAAATMLTGLARGLLFGLTPTDPAAFGAAAGALTFAALIAGFLPARRASSVSPMVALRHE
jgi:predicted permease